MKLIFQYLKKYAGAVVLVSWPYIQGATGLPVRVVAICE